MNELVNKKEADMIDPTQDASWGAEGADSQDMLIPRIQLMQDISESVKKGKHKAGEIIDSTSGIVLGGNGKPITFIPFMTYREWLQFTVDARGKEQYKDKIIMTAENAGWPKEEVVDGDIIRRFKALNFFCMLANDLTSMPYLATFKKTSFYPGKQLSTHFQMSGMKGKPPATLRFKMDSEEKTWETYTFKVFTVSPDKASTGDELGACKKWYDQLRATQAKVSDEFQDDFDVENLEG